MDRLGYNLIYKPHKKIAEHLAFYRVEYEGKEISPPIVEKYDISLNEIWISEKLRPYEKYILHHELQEIKYRAEGYDVREAHEKASEDGDIWEDEPGYEELKKEINLVSEEDFTSIPGFGEELYKRLVENRPYFHLDGVKEVPGIGEERFQRLKENFWVL